MKKFLPRWGQLALFSLLFCSMPSLFAQTEIAVNGGFETGDFTGWQEFPSAPGQQTVGAFSPTEGAFAANVNNAQAPSASGIKLANIGIGVVNPGDEITISFDYRGTTAIGGILFAEFFSEIDGGGTSSAGILGGGPLFANADPNVWTPAMFTTTAGADVSGGVSLLLNCVTGAATGSVADLFFDNVSVTVTPSQTTTVGVEICADFECEQAGVTGFVGQVVFQNGPDLDFNNLTQVSTGSTVWCGNFDLEVGAETRYFFRYAGAGVGGEEDVSGLACATSTGDGGVRRSYIPTADAGQSLLFAWESCDPEPDCGAMVAITFNVGTSHIAVSPDGIYLAGGGNFGVPGDNPLTDPDGDGIYSITIMRPQGFSSDYTFSNGACPDFSCKENISGLGCDVPPFSDRRLPSVTQDTVINTCYALCTEDTDCPLPPMVDITFNVGTRSIDVSPDGIFLAGGGNFGVPGDNQLTDPDGDGVYSITITRPEGFQSFYTFTNGACPDFSCKENIAGQPCADPANFNDRFLPAVANDTIVSTCFGQCTDDTNCLGAEVEFCVDIGCIMPTGTVNVFGIFPTSFFDPFANEMMDDDGDGIYCTTVFLLPGDTEFKFIVNPGMPNEINEAFEVGDDCTVSCCDGAFTNRVITVENEVDQFTNFVFDVPCESMFDEPTVEFPALDLNCGGEDILTVTGGATPEGGVYSGTGVTDNGDGTFDVDQNELTDFMTEVTYTLDGELECVYTATSTFVVDGVDPVVTTADQFGILSDDDGTFMVDSAAAVVSVVDDCDVTIVLSRSLLFTCEDIGENEVTVTATDVNGNVGTSTFTVTIDFNQPELACIGEINLTLNDECQALVIPQMLLTGNVACLDVFNWDIVVQDSDPSNGPIIDGCGSFTYSISAGSNGDEPTVGFTNEFAEENWDVDFIDDDPTLETSVEFTDETLTFTTFGQSPINFNEAFASIQLSENGTVSFDFSYNGVDPFTGFFGDFAVIQTSFEGVALMTEFFDNEASGSRTLAVSAGETLTFALSDDGLFALPPNEDLASIFEISNFLFERPTSPFDLDFETCWGVVNAEDKTSPEADFVPADVTLLCVDFESDANNVSTLPNSVSRCYRVDAETGATIAGSMAPALRARLLAGRTSLEGPLVPTFTDGCAQELEVCVSDAVAFGEDADCDDIVLTRTFVATEISTCVSAGGEMNAPAVASYTITFDRPTLADLNTDGIQDVVEYEQCGTVNPTRADYPAPRAGDFPSLIVGDRVFNLRSGEAVCNIGVTYSDGEAIVTCPYTYKFIRTYTVIDWCDPSDVRTFTQVVKVGDTTAPVLTGPNVATNDAGDLVYGTNAGNICAAYLRLDDISVVDNCSGTNVSVSAEIFPGGDDTGAPIGAFTVVPGGSPELSSAIPAGRHLLRYTSTDECGNTAIDDFFFVVEDQTPPVAICEDGLNISIAGGANNGFAVLTPENIDNGSYDDCSGVSLSIARVNSSDLPIGTYGPQITLTCADLGTVRVGLRVEDALGNVNFCWLDVLVEDKLRPTCVAPANTTITCTEYNTTLPADIQDATDAQLDAIFGAAAGVDNCNTTITQSISGDVNSCGVGTFTRTFVSTDDAGFTNAGACTQRIDVIGIHDYRLTFPTDESGDCADIPEYDGIGAEELACDLITTTTDVDTLRTLDAGDECFKLRITYDVVNWCEYNSLGDPYLVTRDGSGVNNRQRQPRNIDEDVLYVNVIPNNTAGTGDDQAFMTLFTDRALNTNAPQRDVEFVGYAGSDSRGFFRYTQFIKIYDEVAPEITFTELDECFAGSGEGCRTTVVIEFTALDECSDAVVGVELDANYVEAAGFNADNAAALGIGVSVENDGAGNYTVTATNVPVGEHALRVRASDGCGNFDVQIIEFCVTADRTPTPICIQTLTVVLMDDGNGGGTAAIWASDFIASPIEDCFGNEVTKYSLFRSSEAGAAGFVPSFDPPATNGIDDIDCDDFEAGTVSVRVYAFDDNGSTPDYCEVIVEVQDNMGWCDGSSGDLSGFIGNDNDEMMANVEVTLTGANGMDETSMTNADGAFNFTNLPLGGDYTVQPSYDAPVNLLEVKSSDMVDIIGNILGTSQFDSPYDYVAADVNGDHEVSIFDVIEISQMILGQRDVFSIGTNWVFVTAETEIDINNPYGAAFPQVYNANDLAGSLRNVDFFASELGNTFNLAGRSAQSLNADDVQLEAGQTHTLVLDGSTLAAFQGTIELAAGLELVTADYAGEGAINLDRAAEGMIAVALRDNASLSLEVRATQAGLMSELVSLTDAITVREGVTAAGISNSLSLNFTGVVEAGMVNSLEQNTPNPVADVTKIAYTLATAGQVTLNIQDVQGRTIMVREMEGVAGRNVITVNVTELGTSTGVLSYTLTAGDFSATKKMVVVK